MKTRKEYKIATWTFLALMWITNIPMYFVDNDQVSISLIVLWLFSTAGYIYNALRVR